VEPTFINTERGQIYAICHWAENPTATTLIHVPAFAEEMNRCRAQVARTARALAAQGVNVLIFDPFGTGDSSGEFDDFSFEGLANDLAAVNRWLDQRTSGLRALWGLRLGASLAVRAAALESERYAGLLLWSPIVSGGHFLKQFLRIRVAANFGENSAQKLTVADLEGRLAAGQDVDVGGYRLTPALAEELKELDLAKVTAPPLDWLAWFESRPSADLPQPKTTAALQQAWGSALARFHAETVVGPAFWSQVEPQPSPELERRTCQLIAELAS